MSHVLQFVGHRQQGLLVRQVGAHLVSLGQAVLGAAGQPDGVPVLAQSELLHQGPANDTA